MNLDGEHGRFEALIDAARGGDRDARDELFRLAQAHFDSWIKQHPTGPRFRRRHADLDLFQYTALRALERLPTVHANSPAEFLAWFDEILVHKEAELLRHDYTAKKRDGAREAPLDRGDGAGRPATAATDARADPCREASDHELASAVQDALAELPERERSLVELRFWADLSYQAIAERMHESPEAVRSSLRRVMGRLCERLRIARE